MGKVYIIIKLPKIKQFYIDSDTIDEITKFAWIKKIGFGIIKYIDIEIGGKLIDRHYGEWLNIWNELFENKNHYKSVNNMIGNIDELTTFTNGKDEYTLYVPLQFWFCRESGSSLPLISLQYSDVKISVELNNAEDCYVMTPTHYIELFSDIVNFTPYEYIEQNINGQIASGLFTHFDFMTKRLYYKKISTNDFQSIPSTSISISDITSSIFDSPKNFKYFIRGIDSNYFAMAKPNAIPHINTISYQQVNNLMIPNCFLLVEYFYIDNEERQQMLKTRHDYLIEQVCNISEQTVESTNRIVNIDLIQPSKLLVWVLQQNYIKKQPNNDHFNYTDSYIYKNNKQIGKSLIKQETFKLNSHDRISKRSYQYFNHVQAHQHLNNELSEGINLYSFGIYPEKLQPSGSCNMSMISNVQLDLTNQNIITIKNTATLRVYSLGYNVLRIVNGIAGLVFTR